jgi:hypothetical protein
VRSKERAPGTKKQREFTLDDLNANRFYKRF